MSSNYQEIIDRQIESRKAFGRMMLNWRLSNGWTQYTACEWAKIAGFEIISYGNLSVIEQGKAGELRQKAFFQLDELNRRLAWQKDLLKITDINLRSLIERAGPIECDKYGIWDAVDFWSCYTGFTEVPCRYKFSPAPVTSQKKAAELCNQWRHAFRIELKRRLQSGVFADMAFANLVELAPKNMRSNFSAMLLGEDYTQAQLQLLWQDEKYLPGVWISKWRDCG